MSRRRNTGAKPGPTKPRRSRWRRWLMWILLLPPVLSVLWVLSYRYIDPPGSMVMLDRWWTRGAAQPLDHRWCAFQEFGPYLPVAVIAAEDQRFLQHGGFDFVEIDKALQDAERGGRLRGASTLSQQVAKNLFLWDGRSWLRKGLEAWFTLWIEWLWPKQRILEIYLNIAETGEGMFGFCSACQARFGRDCRELSPYNLALLAATLPSPLKMRADQPTPYLHRRASWIVTQAQQLGGPGLLQDM